MKNMSFTFTPASNAPFQRRDSLGSPSSRAGNRSLDDRRADTAVASPMASVPRSKTSPLLLPFLDDDSSAALAFGGIEKPSERTWADTFTMSRKDLGRYLSEPSTEYKTPPHLAPFDPLALPNDSGSDSGPSNLSPPRRLRRVHFSGQDAVHEIVIDPDYEKECQDCCVQVRKLRKKRGQEVDCFEETGMWPEEIEVAFAVPDPLSPPGRVRRVHFSGQDVVHEIVIDPDYEEECQDCWSQIWELEDERGQDVECFEETGMWPEEIEAKRQRRRQRAQVRRQLAAAADLHVNRHIRVSFVDTVCISCLLLVNAILGIFALNSRHDSVPVLPEAEGETHEDVPVLAEDEGNYEAMPEPFEEVDHETVLSFEPPVPVEPVRRRSRRSCATKPAGFYNETRLAREAWSAARQLRS